MLGELPEHLIIGETAYEIRSDFRNVLQVFEAFRDLELYQMEKWIVTVYLLLKPFTCAEDVEEAVKEGFDINEALRQILWFISAGKEQNDRNELPVYDWVQDEQMIFSAVNKIAGKETRELEYLHWWTFLGYFNEIGEGSFSFIVGIRNKLNKKKKLDSQEREFLYRNKELIRIEKPKTKAEQKQEAELKSLLDEVL